MRNTSSFHTRRSSSSSAPTSSQTDGALRAPAPAPGGTTFAIVWLSGCSGCHTAVTDPQAFVRTTGLCLRLAYHPRLGPAAFPSRVDLTLVEGSVASDADLDLLRTVRAHSRLLLSYGDCAVRGKLAAPQGGIVAAPRLAAEFGAVAPPAPDHVRRYRALPVHLVVPVDILLDGCPPAPEEIRAAVRAALADQAE